MKNKKPFLFLSLISLIVTITFFSCQKDVVKPEDADIPAGQSQLQVMLTDDPSQIFDSIFIDIKMLEVKIKDSAGREFWDTLAINPGVYNILRFSNGLDTLLASGNIPNGEVRKIRVTLGTNNYVMLNGVSIPLHLSSSGDAVITIDVNGHVDRIGNRRFRIWLDFDGHGSIRLHNGRLELKLHISHFCHSNSGEIEGEIKPSAAFPVVVTAIAGTDTLTAIPDHDGDFKIRGIKSATATIIITPSNGYKDSVINNIQIRQGKETDLGKIVLHR